MALRDQPYIPLYVQDIMTDEKLNECSAATHGIYIKGIMCLMHKSKDYGKLLLKQKYKQDESKPSSKIKALAFQLIKHLPYSEDEIFSAIKELLDEEVCFWDGDYLTQPRMVKDNEISLKRSKAGKKGGDTTQSAKAKLEANDQANSEYEYEDENNKRILSKFQNSEFYLTKPYQDIYEFADDKFKNFIAYMHGLNDTKTTYWECIKLSPLGASQFEQLFMLAMNKSNNHQGNAVKRMKGCIDYLENVNPGYNRTNLFLSLKHALEKNKA